MEYNFQIDLGVVGKPLKEKFKSDLYYIPYMKQKIVIIAGKGSKFYNNQTLKLNDLNGENFINRESGSETRRVFEDNLKKASLKVNTIMEVSRTTMVQAVKENIGIGLISEPEFDNYKDIKKIHIEDYDIFTQAYLVCLKKKKSDNLVNAFIETAKKIILD